MKKLPITVDVEEDKIGFDYLAFLGISTDDPGGSTYSINPHETSPTEPNYDALRPYLGYINEKTVKNTLKNTTQYARQEHSNTYLKKHYKSRFPALNVKRRNEAVATDTVFSDVPAICNGSKCAQIFVGRDSLVTDAFGMMTDKEFVNTLEDIIRRRGAMDKLISDSAKSEISNKVLDILRAYCIDDWQSEPHHQHQNFAERRYQTIKRLVNTIMDRTGAPAKTWLLCLQYVCYLLNRLSSPTLANKTPLEAATGERPDISNLLMYTFYQPVYYKAHDDSFPSKSQEKKGYWVGISEHCGDTMTYLILTEDTSTIMPRSELRPVTDKAPNLRADPDIGERESKPILFVKDCHDIDMSKSPQMPTISPDDLLGRTFLLPPTDSGERFRAKISRKILDDGERENPEYDNVRFLLQVDGHEADQIIEYNQIIDQINAHIDDDLNDDGEQVWRFQNNHCTPRTTST